jgi:hypothetical protein
VGYIAAGSTTNGYWLIKYASTVAGGSLAGTYPSVTAPTQTSTQLDLSGVKAFGTGYISMAFTLAGNGGSSAAAYSALTQYQTYSFSFQFSGSGGCTPATYTVNMVYLGAF